MCRNAPRLVRRMLTSEYMLWTDKMSRELIEKDYPWFLPVFDSYPYNIQRADVIRYFVLHKYGGVYMDLDIGCARPMDPLLRFDVIVPRTIPVGVSNDLILATKGHPFLVTMIENLKSFNHAFITPYATVMFSTGPMFVSAMYHKFSQQHVARQSAPDAIDAGFEGVRVLPKALYGKNVDESEAPDSFYRHYYGSSWHSGDAGFLIFLRKYGYVFIGIGVVAVLSMQLRRIRRVLSFFYVSVMDQEPSDRVVPGVTVDRANFERLPRDSSESHHSQCETEDVPLFQLSGDKRTSISSDAREPVALERSASSERTLGTYTHAGSPGRRHALPTFYVDSQSAHAMAPGDSNEHQDAAKNHQASTRRFSRVRRAVANNVAMPFTSLVSALRAPRRWFGAQSSAGDDEETFDDRLSMISVVSRNTDTMSDTADDAAVEWASVARAQRSPMTSPPFDGMRSQSPTQSSPALSPVPSPVPSPMLSIGAALDNVPAVPQTHALHWRNARPSRAMTPAIFAQSGAEEREPSQ